jgi:hydroxypyruvate isomerase
VPTFAANISMLFTEYPFVERIERAAAVGFRGIEILYPYTENIDDIESSLESHSVSLVLFNVPAGNVAGGERGFANDPRRSEEFRAGVTRALEIAQRLDCPKLNCLCGRFLDDVPVREQWQTLKDNLDFAATEARKLGIIQLVEPLNTIDNPGFMLPTPHSGFNLIEEIGHPNLLVQFDIYHAQRSEGNLTQTVVDHIGQIGHVQIADSPDRNEPGTGEIAYPYVLRKLGEAGYNGWVSLEYKPSTTTEDSLRWLRDWGYLS